MSTLASRLFCLGLVSVFVNACAEDPEPDTATTDPTPTASAQGTASARPSMQATATAAPSATQTSAVEPDAATSNQPPRPVPSGSFELGDSGVVVEWSESGLECGGQMCPDGKATDLGLSLNACCDQGDVCGLDFSDVGLLFGLKDPGCEEFARPGNPDETCPESEPVQSLLAVQQGLDGFVLAPCCQASGKCGFVGDFAGFGFGCLEPERFGQTGGQQCDSAL